MGSRLRLDCPTSKAPRCLKCHVDQDYELVGPNFRKQNGVGCEGCHGHGGGYFTLHYKKEIWKKEDKNLFGMAETKHLQTRAKICIRCHVGTPGNEVDHDLIAAGHPPLRFEFATYFANLPPHWNVVADKEANGGKSDFEMRVWTIGQFETMAASLELLVRHSEPDAAGPWPELSDLDCFACHHHLNPMGWRQAPEHLRDRRGGRLALNRWYNATLPDLVSLPVGKKLQAKADSFYWAHDSLERNLLALESRQDFAKQARELASALRGASLLNPVAPIASWLDRLGPKRAAESSWEESTHHYFALLALRAELVENGQPREDVEKIIEKLGKATSFGELQSPQRFIPPALQNLQNH